MASVKSELCPTCRGTGYAQVERNGTRGVVPILTTNYLDQEDLKSPRKSVSYSLAERIGEPMRSRLYEMCMKVERQGEDFRQRFKPDEHRL